MPGLDVIALLGKAAIALSKFFYKKSVPVETPTQKAIRATSASFPGEVEEALKTWSECDEYTRLLRNLKAGNHDLIDKNTVHSFIKLTNFYMGGESETEKAAENLLTVFIENLRHEIYIAPEGVSAVATRMEVLLGAGQSANS